MGNIQNSDGMWPHRAASHLEELRLWAVAGNLAELKKALDNTHHPCLVSEEMLSVLLSDAAANNRLSMAQYLLALGADPMRDHGQALQWASAGGHAQMCALLCTTVGPDNAKIVLRHMQEAAAVRGAASSSLVSFVSSLDWETLAAICATADHAILSAHISAGNGQTVATPKKI